MKLPTLVPQLWTLNTKAIEPKQNNLSWNSVFCIQKYLYLKINTTTSFLNADVSHRLPNPTRTQTACVLDVTTSNDSTDSCFLCPSLLSCKISQTSKGQEVRFQNAEFYTSYCRKAFFFLPTLHNSVQNFSTKIRTGWLLWSPCCCLLIFAAEEFLSLLIPTDTKRWTCKRIHLCLCLNPFLADAQ